MTDFDPQIQCEVSRRRTFAIISHPDAGKTTLTEKLLLFGGCIEVAGAVRGRKSQRAATADWMELEKQRGISVSSTVLPFDFVRYRLENEYNTQTEINWLPFTLTRWIDCETKQLKNLRVPYSAKLVKDQIGHHALLFHSQWDATHAASQNPTVRFSPMRTA